MVHQHRQRPWARHPRATADGSPPVTQGSKQRTSPPSEQPPPVDALGGGVVSFPLQDSRLAGGVTGGSRLGGGEDIARVTVVKARSWINRMVSSYTVVTAGKLACLMTMFAARRYRVAFRRTWSAVSWVESPNEPFHQVSTE